MAQFAALYNVNIGSGSSPTPPPVYIQSSGKYQVRYRDLEGNIVAIQNYNEGDTVNITLHDGTIETTVNKVSRS